MKIALDASALIPGGGGIGRYLAQLLPRMIGASHHDWLLYGRDASHRLDGATMRDDRLPAHAGRILSLFTTQPLWARRDRPDVFWGPAHRLPVGLPAATARVVTIHDLCHLAAPRTMRRSTRLLDTCLMPRALRAADRVIAVSHATHKALEIAFPWAASRVVTVHEGGSAWPPAGSARREAARYVLFVGTIEPRKNLARLFEAFARTPPDVRLLLAGGRGWHSDAPAALAARWGIGARVQWLGTVDDATLATLYAHAEFLALPSLYEGFGLPLLEALSFGTPVLYGDNSSMPEVAGEAGLPVDAHSVDSIAEGMRRLLTEHGLRDALAARARAQAAKFSWDRAARETLAVFEAAVAARQARRA